MAIFPRADAVKLLPESSTQSRIKPTIVIVHTHVGNPSIDGMFSSLAKESEGKEHHFNLVIGGQLGQYMDTETRADNNFRANEFSVNGISCGAVSIETGDQSPDLSKTFSDLGQLDVLVDLIAWLCETHDIPARKCPSSREPGIGFHSMWGLNELGPGDGTFGHITDEKGRNIRLNNEWTNAVGKSCPGAGKISEFNRLIDEVSRRLGDPIRPFSTSKGDDDMRYKLFKIIGAHNIVAVGPGNPFNPGSPELAQELVDRGQVADRDGKAVAPGTFFRDVAIEVSEPLWQKLSGLGEIPVPR